MSNIKSIQEDQLLDENRLLKKQLEEARSKLALLSSTPTNKISSQKNSFEETLSIRELVNRLPLVVLSFDKEGIIKQFGGMGSSTLPRDQQRWVGKTIYELYKDPENAELLDFCKIALTGKSFTAVVQRPGNRLFEIQFWPVTDKKGRLSQVNCLAFDVTAREKAEEGLRRSQQQLKAIIDNSPALIHLKDLEGRYLLVNRYYAEVIINKKFEDIVGKTCFDLFPPEIAAQYHGDDLKLLANGDQIIVEQNSLHSDGLHSNIALKTLLKDDKGQPYAICGISTDITERKQAEKKILGLNQELEERVKERTSLLEASLASLKIGLSDRLVIEEKLKMQATQQSQLANLGQQALSGMEFSFLLEQAVDSLVQTLEADFSSVIEVCPDGQSVKFLAGRGWHEGVIGHTFPLNPEATDGLLVSTLKTRNPMVLVDWETETELKKTGLPLHQNVASSMTTLLKDREKIFGILRVHWKETRKFGEDDINFFQAIANVLSAAIQSRALEEELRKALDQEKELGELKTRFVTMASHEFRTPLSTILANSELLEHYSHKWTETKKKELFGRIQTSVKYMTQMLDGVLLLGKDEAGKLLFQPHQVNIEEFSRSIMQEVLVAAFNKRNIILNASGACEKVWLDHNLVRHILVNLLSNALKYSAGDKEVYFSLTCSPESITFKIKDQGYGFSPEDQEHLFEPFHRGKNVGTVHGTGLGLSIVKRSVGIHGGQINLVSTPGEGSEFTVILPFKNPLPQD